MKRIVAVTNKRKSLEKFANHLKSTVYTPGVYNVIPNLEDNTVDVYEVTESGATKKIIARYTLDTTEDKEQRYKYRKATQNDINSGAPLFVKEPYTAYTNKQIPQPKRVDTVIRHE